MYAVQKLQVACQRMFCQISARGIHAPGRADSNDQEIKRKNQLSFQKYIFPFKLKCFKAKQDFAYCDWPVLSHDSRSVAKTRSPV